MTIQQQHPLFEHTPVLNNNLSINAMMTLVTMCPAKAGQSGAVGTKSGPSGPSEDLRGPQKGHFGPKRSLLGPLGAQKGLDTRSKCVVSMTPTQTGQSWAVGTKSGPPGPSEDLRGPRKDLLWPKRALFASF